MKRLRFSIRTLLLLATVVALAIVVYRRQTGIREVVRRLESVGGKVEYRNEFLGWFHARTGHFFATPVAFHLGGSRVGRGDLKGIERLAGLERLYLDRTSIGNKDVAEIAKCKRLKRLGLRGNFNLSSEIIAELVKLTELEALDIAETRVSPSMLGKLGTLPNLEWLVFPEPFHFQQENSMNGEVMRQLSTVRHLQPVGECLLWRFDGEEIRLFCAAVTPRVDRLVLRNCELTADACEALNSVKAREFDIQSCEIGDQQLQLIDHQRFYRVNIAKHRDRSRPDVTLAGLTRWMPAGLEKVAIRDGRVEFGYPSVLRWKYRLSEVSASLTESMLNQWIELGMEVLYLNDRRNLVADMQLVAAADPPIHLVIDHHPFLWPLINRMRRLKGVTVYDSDSVPIRLDEGLTIETLELCGLDDPTLGLFVEITQLKRLVSLRIENQTIVSLDEVQPLAKLKNVSHIRISKITPEAQAFVDELCATNQRRQTVEAPANTAASRKAGRWRCDDFYFGP